MSLGLGPEPDLDRVAVSLQHAARIGDHEHTGQLGHRLIPVERLLHEQRRPAVEVHQHGLRAAAFEAEPQVAVFAGRAGGELRRLVEIGGQLTRDRQRSALEAHQATGSGRLMSKST